MDRRIRTRNFAATMATLVLSMVVITAALATIVGLLVVRTDLRTRAALQACPIVDTHLRPCEHSIGPS